MGKGLIPADLETWKIRRRAIVPGFHQKWLQVTTVQTAAYPQRRVWLYSGWRVMNERAVSGTRLSAPPPLAGDVPLVHRLQPAAVRQAGQDRGEGRGACVADDGARVASMIHGAVV